MSCLRCSASLQYHQIPSSLTRAVYNKESKSKKKEKKGRGREEGWRRVDVRIKCPDDTEYPLCRDTPTSSYFALLIKLDVQAEVKRERKRREEQM